MWRQMGAPVRGVQRYKESFGLSERGRPGEVEALFTSSECNDRSRDVMGDRKNMGRIIGYDRWKADTTLGRNETLENKVTLLG